MPINSSKTLEPRSFIIIRPLPISPPKGQKLQARSDTVYSAWEPCREHVFRENYHRRQKQLGQQGYWTASGRLYQEIGEPLYLDPKKLILHSLGQQDQVSSEKWLYLKNREKELKILKRHLSHTRQLVSAVKQGRGYFQMLQREECDLRNAQQEEQQSFSESQRTEWQPPKYSSDEEVTERGVFRGLPLSALALREALLLLLLGIAQITLFPLQHLEITSTLLHCGHQLPVDTTTWKLLESVHQAVDKELHHTDQEKKHPNERKRWENSTRKFQSLEYVTDFHRDISLLRAAANTSDSRDENSQKSTTWFSELLSRIPKAMLESHNVQSILGKLSRLCHKQSLRVGPSHFLKVLSGIRTWELCSPDLSVAIEIVREHIVQMSKEDYEAWLLPRVGLPQRVRSAPAVT
ncbi:UNVERIFIED_CONTAM: hypothetical protein FKN15_073644 [Acipenser sinensis]